MHEHSPPPSAARRRFLVTGACAVVAVPLASLMTALPAQAQDLPKIDESDPQAAALGYKHDASAVDTQRFPKRKGEAGAKQFCHNCNLFQGTQADGWAPCQIFPGKSVAAEGWCNAWVPRAG